MPIKLDYGKLQGSSAAETITDPRKLFTVLSRALRFKRPSDEQGEVLDRWYADRARQDHTLKMNTGSGKTLVGLLILQSSLNEGVKPAIYVTPDNHLAAQVIAEAKDLGIAVTEEANDARFLAGKAILVINVHRLFNGKSVFGVGGTKIPIGACVIDDAHACLSIVNRQFSLRLPADSKAYKELFALFKSDLDSQAGMSVIRIEQNDPTVYVTVPFWSWKNHLAEVAKILYKYRDESELLFTLPLIYDSLALCQCVIGGYELEIAPWCIPVEAIPSFAAAKRRIYMTATLADDGVLVSSFNADPVAVQEPIRPKGVGSMGERMILLPQGINPKITDEDIRSFVADLSRKYNVVVIVPSKMRAAFWKSVAHQILDKDSIDKGVEKLKAGHVGLTVLLNKYDGVDLPEDACRVLVIDGLPEVLGLNERAEAAALEDSNLILIRQVQKIEQGMGRGVRSADDHCVVLLMGRKLTQRIHLPDARQLFTSATQAQLQLGDGVTEQIKGAPISELRNVVDLCLKREPEWVQTSRTVLANAAEGNSSLIDPAIVYLRRAFDAGRTGLWQDAVGEAQKAVNVTSERAARGWRMQALASYQEHINPVQAQETIISALRLNPRVTKPINGATYTRINQRTADQAAASVDFMSRFDSGMDLAIWINGLLDDLVWDEDGTEAFEAAVKNLGLFLGFGSQRPEAEIGKGPDNLWAVGDDTFLVIEDKSGAKQAVISKTDCNQLNGSLQWFRTTYDPTAKAVPMMFHQSSTFDRYSSPDPNTRIVSAAGLESLKSSLKQLSVALGAGATYKNVEEVGKLLKQFHLNGGSFSSFYGEHYKVATK